MLADSSGDELHVLAAEVENRNCFVVHIFTAETAETAENQENCLQDAQFHLSAS